MSLRPLLAPLAALLLVACSSAPGDLPPGPTGAPGDMTAPMAPPMSARDGGTHADAMTPPPPAVPSHGEEAVLRAREWVAAKMPYCGGPNGGHDVICGGTCVRSGTAASPLWDKYRSDCSGLISWAWKLPAPGHVTSTFAPFDMTVSETIPGTDLQPGDALNNNMHAMLFAGWADAATHMARVIQESTCGTNASERVVGLKVDATSSVEILDTTGRIFHAIRYVKR